MHQDKVLLKHIRSEDLLFAACPLPTVGTLGAHFLSASEGGSAFQMIVRMLIHRLLLMTLADFAGVVVRRSETHSTLAVVMHLHFAVHRVQENHLV